jgi:hypothetical protein
LSQSFASATAPVHSASGRLVPPGWPGLQAVSVIALTRAIVLIRLTVAFVYAVSALLLSDAGAESLRRFLVPLVIIALVSAAEIAVLPRLATGPPRVLLVLADSAVAMLIYLVWTGDPVHVIFQMGAAALAGALLGRHGSPLWVGQGIQAAGTCWVILHDKVAPPVTTVVLVTAPALILAAGASAVVLTQLVQDRLNRDLEPSGSVSEIYARVLRTLRAVSLAWLRGPGRADGRATLIEDLARTLTQDLVVGVEQARVPVMGFRFNVPAEEFADSLQQMCDEWNRRSRVSLSTELMPVWLRVTARHQLALIVEDALSNITDHAHSTRAQVELAERRHVVTLVIKDNGRGFTVPADPAVLRGGDYPGICRMISRSSFLGADLSITTAPYDAGTEIKVRMPA